MGLVKQVAKNVMPTVLKKDCEQVMVWDYFTIQDSGNYSLLVKSGAIPSKKVLVAHMEKITREFQELRNEPDKTSEKYELLSYAEELRIKIHTVFGICKTIQLGLTLNLMAIGTFDGLIGELKKWGYRLNTEVPLIDELERIDADCRAIATTIESIHEQVYPQPEDGEQPEVKNLKIQMYRTFDMYARILKEQRRNPKKTSLMEFAIWEQSVREIIKKQPENESTE